MAIGIFKILTPLRIGAVGILKWAIKHYYWFILILVLLPATIGSIRQGVEQRNPAIPAIDIALYLTNADAQIYEDVQILKENPAELVGMEYPEIGIWKHVVYGWKFFWNVIFREFGFIWMIFFPFILIYKIFRFRGSKGLQSSKSADFMKTVLWGLFFITFVNMLLITTGTLDGTLIANFPEDITKAHRALLILYQALPFHGIGSLIYFLVTRTIVK
jgi:hypothetical protein